VEASKHLILFPVNPKYELSAFNPLEDLTFVILVLLIMFSASAVTVNMTQNCSSLGNIASLHFLSFSMPKLSDRSYLRGFGFSW